MSQLSLPVKLRDDATFDNFFAKNNLQPINYLQRLINQNSNETIYLWGSSGSGCSHLLQACCHLASKNNYSSLYCSLKNILSFQTSVFDNIETLQLICLDDLDAITLYPHWQEALFHLYNRIGQTENKLLLTAKSPPNQLTFGLKDLISRLTASTIFQIKPLTDDQKIQALQTRAKLRGMELARNVCEFMLHHFCRDTTSLFAALDKLDEASLVEKHKLTIPFVKRVLLLPPGPPSWPSPRGGRD